ncbi:hypothetical protein LENED_010269 [Lentinula edodes]|uniref:Uncharacterized protein n=1 Tax=Lentinula edodes TaxID=5353 RepID=A0A1Q3EM19_LENED|nr:hypothetical protein LENED_010269 [Lentinula edodes]
MVKELTAYLYRESPFDIPVKDATGPEIDKENLSFNISDPYGATALEDGENEDDEEMDDTGVIPIITRASIDCLKICPVANCLSATIRHRR